MFNKKPKKMMVEMVRMELVRGRGVRWSELLAGLGLAKTGRLVKLCRPEQVFRQDKQADMQNE